MLKTQKVTKVMIAAALLMVPVASANATTLPTPTTDACTGMKVDTTSDVNLRSKASATASIVGVVANGTTLNVMDCTGGSNWWHVNLGGTSGFVSSHYTVELGNMDVSTLPIQVPPVCDPTQVPIWTTQAVNLRAAASATSKIKQVLPGGAKLTVLDCAGSPNWKHVAYNGAQGFVSARYTVQQLSNQ